MKICFVHNKYGKFSGEEAILQGQISVLERKGHQICTFIRSSKELSNVPFGQIRAFLSGIYNPWSRKKFRKYLENERPHIVHIHNLYPLISPSVLDACVDLKVPVVMTVHNYRLICPNGLFMVRGEVCERCTGGKEYWCLLRNCEENYLKSLGYFLRNFCARVRRSYLDNVNHFAVLTDFQRQKLVKEGFQQLNITVLPNMTDFVPEISPKQGDYIGYIGRISPEKGLKLLIFAARRCETVVFKAAGNYEKMPELLQDVPTNFSFLGQLDRNQVEDFFMQSRVIILCNICYEGFPVVLVEAMLSGKPVIAPRIGGIPEIIDDGVTGLLFEAGNVDDLADKIQYLWGRPDLCRQMGEMGRQKALREYSPEKYYQRLMDVYRKARKICKNEAITTI